MSDELVNKVTIIAGERGSGKTNTGKALIQAYADLNGSDHRILIIDTLNHPQYSGIQQLPKPEYLSMWKDNKGVLRLFAPPPEGCSINYNLQYVCTQHDGRYLFRNGLLVIEDATKLLEGKLDEWFKTFVVDSKQINVDILLMFHGFCFVPPRLWKFTDKLIIHKTKEQWNAIKGRIPAAPLVEEAFKRVQAHKSKYYCEVVNL